ncbi:MAG: hypothetical protein V8S39_06920 [Lachnospiraceae bacterium]|jgi:uncharacterized protein
MNNIIKVIAVAGIMIGTGNMQDINCEAAIPEVTAYVCENSEISLQASKVTWVYKQENGKKYKRLYDKTNEVWLTDWILC